MYYIVNRQTEERMYQYNATYYYDVAVRMLNDARSKYPKANACIEYDPELR